MSSSRAGALIGALGVLAVPAAVIAPRVVGGVTLLGALYYAVPLALVLGLVALAVSRRARFSAQRTVFANRAGPVRSARILAWLAVYIGITSGISIAVYWVFRSRH